MSDLHAAACAAIEELEAIGMPTDGQRMAAQRLRKAIAQTPVAYVEEFRGGRRLIWAMGSEALAIEPGTPLFAGSKPTQTCG